MWVLGKQSRNKRHYPDEVLQRRHLLYEAAQVFIDHDMATVKKGGTRPMHELGGIIRDVRFAPDGLRANLHYLKDTKAGQMILNAAKTAPDKFGLSPMHRIEGWKQSNGSELIKDILEVHSVDVVTRPASTKGLWESVMDSEEEVDADCATLLGLAMAAAAKEGNHDLATKILKLMKKEHGAGEGEPGEEGEPPDAEEESVTASPQAQQEVVTLLGTYQHMASESQFDELAALPTTKARIAAIIKMKTFKRPAAAKLPAPRSGARVAVEAVEDKPAKAGEAVPLASEGATTEQIQAWYLKNR